MARYQVMYWKDIPAQVRVREGDQRWLKAMLPDRFTEAIDAAAMADGSTESAAYLDGWAWGAELEQEGTAQTVLAGVVAELDAGYPPEKLKEMIRERRVGRGQNG